MFYRKPLTYSFSSLEPYIDYPTMNEHYNAHYKKYTDNLNQLVPDNDGSEESVKNIIKNTMMYGESNTKVRNNAGGYYNHLLYFENISPYNRGYENFASENLKLAIGDFSKFKERFSKIGAEVFGSGWVWLVQGKGDIISSLYGNTFIMSTVNQDNPLMSIDCNILLGMDVWEHAYYLKHKANRKAYIDAFFQTIDWKVVSDRLK